ncbi:MAG TPA: DUF309 domain-containing protein [Candidatus Acidoferrales bacterium]|nr:DUF309 domain-containing protein [Candidatus Acidoferrales bacterium]
MRFLVRLENGTKLTPKDARELALSAYGAVKRFGGDVGNLRVSSSAVELDLLLESTANLHSATQSLENKIGPLLTLRELDVPGSKLEPGEAIREGIQLFNEERYWESHEALESAWRRSSGDDKEILQGIILLAAALVHLQKNEISVSLSVMGRAHSKLTGHHSERFGINIDDLRDYVSSMISEGRPDFLKIKLRH